MLVHKKSVLGTITPVIIIKASSACFTVNMYKNKKSIPCIMKQLTKTKQRKLFSICASSDLCNAIPQS